MSIARVSAFQPTRPRGARQKSSRLLAPPQKFQPTRPRGARHGHHRRLRQGREVSTHAPARGATRRARRLRGMTRCFNPRAREGRDLIYGVAYELLYMFQPTRPRGARLWARLNLILAATFQPTRPRGARPQAAQSPYRLVRSFNPRAREGRDSSSMHSHRIEPITLYRKSLSADFSTLITPIRRANPARTSLGNLQSLRFARDFRTETVYTSRRNYLCARR